MTIVHSQRFPCKSTIVLVDGLPYLSQGVMPMRSGAIIDITGHFLPMSRRR